MNRLVKAEFYKFTHSGIMLSIWIAVSLFAMVLTFTFSNNPADFTAEEMILASSRIIPMLIPVFVSLMISTVIGLFYYKRVGDYEIMDGNSPHSIILSKISVYLPAALIIFFTPSVAATVIMGLKNGWGNLDGVAVYCVLTAVAYIHALTATILTSVIVKGIFGIPIPYLRYMMFESVIFVLLMESNPDNGLLKKISHWLVGNQFFDMSAVLMKGNTDKLVFAYGVSSSVEDFAIKVVVSCVAEIIALYIIACAAHKKKFMFK